MYFLSLADAYYTVYRIPSAFLERKAYATYVHQLVKATSFMLPRKKLPRDM